MRPAEGDRRTPAHAALLAEGTAGLLGPQNGEGIGHAAILGAGTDIAPLPPLHFPSQLRPRPRRCGVRPGRSVSGGLPHITIQILPFDCTVFAETDTPFMLLHGRHSRLDTVLMEQPQGSPFLGEPDAVASFRRQFERLRGLALPPLSASASEPSPTSRDSWGLLQHIRYAVQRR
ncbi:Scr1 family TA system antitoxin-like transcriptional regulator [Streptomyces sp. LS1784]|uniref:Scr1 family TA system antitoxin-like transcriptional regulator n=1 Tax=Streptomyces sp. LS1784 TaxID=2851533 RepID=UPI0035A93911